MESSLRRSVYALTGALDDYDSLLRRIGDRPLVLIGEASHGTHEFYRERAVLTKRLIVEKGFGAVAVEADWPDAYRVNRYVRGEPGDGDSEEALRGFERFPTWMWRNADVLDFVGWLRTHNDRVEGDGRKVGFYGLDLYSLHASIDAVLSFLDRVDPEAASRARRRYACFDHAEPQDYGYAAELGLTRSCEDEAVQQLMELQRSQQTYSRADGPKMADDFFFAKQNARLVRNAEEYYRSMFRGSVLSWNLRDRHMVETLEALLEHVSQPGMPAKVVVWAHNSHLGDARATEMGIRGEWNVGQLVRERRGSAVYSLGFSTFEGTVTAASAWHGPAERKVVRPALAGSYEALFHLVGLPRFFLPLGADNPVSALHDPRLERAIGVIYVPETERQSHYFHASLPEQFDGILHIDRTRAVEPLEKGAVWERGEVPETYPTGV
ncbi:MAG TPA: erythromycin esterase family protein [Thermoanaerobaculia bacterium]|nr:erythromycin esterase family protein [Thermoanaerobaculia bacterium]